MDDPFVSQGLPSKRNAGLEGRVYLRKLNVYDPQRIYENLPEEVFASIRPGDKVILKPNWVSASHKTRRTEWDYVITHPAVITAVLNRVLEKLGRAGHVVITDGPQTDESFSRLISRYPVELWRSMAEKAGIPLEVIDLRDNEWVTRKDVVVERRKLPGDPRGTVEYNLRGEKSEFHGHKKPSRGYYGADYDREETNRAHDGENNLYRVSRTVMDGDVFINLPKLKTHRKAGVTCCLKNLVGINTYKNYLPHHSEGAPSEGGDQFPGDGFKTAIEGPLTAFLKQNLLRRAALARILGPLTGVGRMVLGPTGEVIRSGNWHGNDTLWRMVADLNKILFYGNSDGTLRPGIYPNRKRYIGIVDAIRAGEGFGPLEPDPVNMNYLICGVHPTAIDTVCATLMGFDYRRIPSIAKSYEIIQYNFTPFAPQDLLVQCQDARYSLGDLPENPLVPFTPPLGWAGHVERGRLARMP